MKSKDTNSQTRLKGSGRTGKWLLKLKPDNFVLAIGGAILLAYLWPDGGLGEGPYSLSELANYGVSIIFLFYGLRLNIGKLKQGLSNWKLHLLIQLSTFVFFPILVLVAKTLLESPDTELLWLGVFFLAALPSTVSSSVVMVSIAEGNIPAAIFNASLSSIMGLFITPLWMGLVITSSGSSELELGSIMGKLVLQVLVPVMVGMLLHGRFGAFADKHRNKLRYFDQLVILIIIYTSFSDSFARNLFEGFTAGDIALLALSMLGVFFLSYFLISMISRLLQFNKEDEITAVFCGSKKSLVHGTVMSKVIFGNAAFVGIVLLPLMLYHALQIIAASIIARRHANRKQAVESAQ